MTLSAKTKCKTVKLESSVLLQDTRLYINVEILTWKNKKSVKNNHDLSARRRDPQTQNGQTGGFKSPSESENEPARLNTKSASATKKIFISRAPSVPPIAPPPTPHPIVGVWKLINLTELVRVRIYGRTISHSQSVSENAVEQSHAVSVRKCSRTISHNQSVFENVVKQSHTVSQCLKM